MFNRLKTAPWRKVFKGLGWFTLLFTLVAGIPDALIAYPDEGLAGALSHLGMIAVCSVFLAALGLYLFTVTWALHDTPKGWSNTKQLVRDFPENWRRFWRGVGAVLAFVISLPGRIVRGLATAVRFLIALPAMWRALPKRDKQATLAMLASMAVWATFAYFIWTPASHFVAWLPTWLVIPDTLIATVFVTMFTSAFAMILVCHLIVPIAFLLLRAAFGRRSSKA